jgi:hypothetical protein
MSARRIVILTVDKGLAETIDRGLRGLGNPAPEVDVVFEARAAGERIRASRCDLLILGPGFAEADVRAGECAGAAIRILPVGGPPGVSRGVPLPFSFGLLEAEVRRALDGGTGGGRGEDAGAAVRNVAE